MVVIKDPRAGRLLAVVALLIVGCSGQAAITTPESSTSTSAPRPSTPGPTTTAATTTTTLPVQEAETQLLAVGDIGRCDRDADDLTSELAAGFPDATIVLLGDIAYPDGTAEEFRDCFDTSWGVHKPRIRPSPGNHDYRTDDAEPYFDYFGDTAGDPGEGYYSFEVGDWHIVALNTNCRPAGGCDAESPQAKWLRTDLAENDTKCTLAFMHHPRFSSGTNGSFERIMPLWEIMYQFGVDVTLSGHDHDYERFAPQDPFGMTQPDRGIRQFVVGTGGGTLREFEMEEPNSEVRIEGEYGILEMTLGAHSYSWRFWGLDGDAPLDMGESTCVDP